MTLDSFPAFYGTRSFNTEFSIAVHLRSGPRLFSDFHKKNFFYGEGLLAPLPTPKLEDHPLQFVRGCLFNIFAATFHCWKPFLHLQPEDVPVQPNPPNMA
jgi:hypothetical protein